MDYRTRFALYVDDHPRMVCTDSFLDRVVDVGYDQIRVMVDSYRRDWDPRFSHQELRILTHLAMVERDLEIVLVFWPICHQPTLDLMFSDLDRMLGQSGAVALGTEAEGHITARAARELGWNVNDAKRYILERLLTICDRRNVTFEATTHPAHPEAREGAVLTSAARRVIWQVYAANRDWLERRVTWLGRYGPHGRGVDADRLADLSRSWGHERPCFAQALYRQGWPGHSIAEGLDIAFDGLMRHDPEIVADWMSGNVVGRFRDNGINPRMREWRKGTISRVKAK